MSKQLELAGIVTVLLLLTGSVITLNQIDSADFSINQSTQTSPLAVAQALSATGLNGDGFVNQISNMWHGVVKSVREIIEKDNQKTSPTFINLIPLAEIGNYPKPINNLSIASATLFQTPEVSKSGPTTTSPSKVAVTVDSYPKLTAKILTTITLPSGQEPYGVAFDGENLWVSTYAQTDKSVKILSVTPKGSVLKTINIDTKYRRLNGLAWDGKYLFAGGTDEEGRGVIAKIDTRNKEVISSFNVPVSKIVNQGVYGLEYDMETKTLSYTDNTDIIRKVDLNGKFLTSSEGAGQYSGLTKNSTAGECLYQISKSGTTQVLSQTTKNLGLTTLYSLPKRNYFDTAYDANTQKKPVVWLASPNPDPTKLNDQHLIAVQVQPCTTAILKANTTSSNINTNTHQQALLENYANRPIPFLKNQGQWNSDILYQGGSKGTSVRFLAGGLSFATSREIEDEQENSNDNSDEREESYESLVYNLDFLNANLSTATTTPIMATGEQPSKINYLKGKDPKKWVLHTPQYQTLTYQNLYKNIDLLFYAQENNLKYDFIVKPGANASDIKLHYRGITSLAINAKGELEVRTPWGVVADQAPYSYQTINNQKQEVKIEYTLLNNDTFGFKILGRYNPTQELIIDPLTLTWSTFTRDTGAGRANYSHDIAIDSNLDAYITGHAEASYTTTPGVYQGNNAGKLDVFVTKIKSDGTDVVYSTFIGGEFNDSGYAIAVNKNGEAFVTGFTSSSNFPTTPGAFQTQPKGPEDAFVTRLNNLGTGLIYSTYLGGTATTPGTYLEQGAGIAINNLDEAFVTGYTSSTDFPTTPGAFQPQIKGKSDAFVTKFNNLGTGLIYSTYLGGIGGDEGGHGSIAINNLGEAFVTGFTGSIDFPITPGAFQTQLKGPYSAFVTKFNNLGTGLIYSTYLGGTGSARGYGIAINNLGEAFVTGFTGSIDFPITPGAFQTQLKGSRDIFITRLNNFGSGLIYSTYLGGTDANYDMGHGIAINKFNEAFVTGMADSPDFPITPGAFQTQFKGGVADVTLTHLSANGKNIGTGGSTYFGGSSADYYYPAVAIDPTGTILYITGTTHSVDFPIQDRFGVKGPAANVYQSTKPNGVYDQPFISKWAIPMSTSIIQVGLPPCAVDNYIAQFIWTGTPDPFLGFKLEIDTDAGFPDPYVKVLLPPLAQPYTTDSRNFRKLTMPTLPPLDLHPKYDYYVRVHDGLSYSPSIKFNVPECVVTVPTLLLYRSTPNQSFDYVKGTFDAKAVAFDFFNPSTATITVKSVTLTGYVADDGRFQRRGVGAPPHTDLNVGKLASKVKLYDGATLLSDIAWQNNLSNDIGTITFLLNWVINPVTLKNLVVKTDISNLPTSGPSDTFSFDIAAIKDVSAVDQTKKPVSIDQAPVNGAGWPAGTYVTVYK